MWENSWFLNWTIISHHCGPPPWACFRQNESNGDPPRRQNNGLSPPSTGTKRWLCREFAKVKVGHTVLSDSLRSQTVACPFPLSVGFPRQEYWRGLPFPGIFLTLGSIPHVLCLLHWQGDSWTQGQLGSCITLLEQAILLATKICPTPPSVLDFSETCCNATVWNTQVENKQKFTTSSMTSPLQQATNSSFSLWP